MLKLSDVENEEVSIIGYLLQNNDLIDIFCNKLKKEHFKNERLGFIYDNLIKFYYKDGAVSAYSFDFLADVEGGKKLLEELFLIQRNSYSLKKEDRRIAKGDVDIIIRNYKYRKIKSIIDNSNNYLENTHSPEEVAEKLAMEFTKLSEKTENSVYNSKEINLEIANNINKKFDVYPTGINILDRATAGGFFSGKMYGIAGRKKMGKTYMACTLSHNLNKQGVKHLFIACEMPPKEIQERQIAMSLGFNPLKFKETKTSDFMQQVIGYCLDTEENNIIYRKEPALTLSKLRNILKYHVVNDGIKGFILDYWQLVRGKRAGISEADHLLDVAQFIAGFCSDNDVFAIVNSQLNQDGNTRGSEGIRLACDQMYFLHKNDLNNAWLELADTRYTPYLDMGNEENPSLIFDTKNGCRFIDNYEFNNSKNFDVYGGY